MLLPKLNTALRKIELMIRKVILPQDECFWCDSHPFLCLTCTRIRSLLHLHHCPKALCINTKVGVFSWIKRENLYFHHQLDESKLTKDPLSWLNQVYNKYWMETRDYDLNNLRIHTRTLVRFLPPAGPPIPKKVEPLLYPLLEHYIQPQRGVLTIGH